MFYILHGENEFTRSEALTDLKGKFGDPTWLTLNTSVLDGRKLTLDELQHACDAIPFFGDRRLVIVEGLLARLEPRGDELGDKPEHNTLTDRLIAYLDRLPQTTRLVFLENKALSKGHPVLKYAGKLSKDQAYVREFEPLKKHEIGGWIQKRVKNKGGTIHPAAVAQLEAFLGNDLRLLDQEIEKLLTYTGGRAISETDVRLMVSSVREANIFEMVDAVAARDRRRALGLLHELLDDGQAPLYLLTMIVRQFRILMQLRELAAQGQGPEGIRARLGLHPFVVEKGLRQVRNFSLAQLDAIYDRLLETDAAIKTGRSDPVLALDLLVTALTEVPRTLPK